MPSFYLGHFTLVLKHIFSLLSGCILFLFCSCYCNIILLSISKFSYRIWLILISIIFTFHLLVFSNYHVTRNSLHIMINCILIPEECMVIGEVIYIPNNFHISSVF